MEAEFRNWVPWNGALRQGIQNLLTQFSSFKSWLWPHKFICDKNLAFWASCRNCALFNFTRKEIQMPCLLDFSAVFANCHPGSPITCDHHRDIAGISGQGHQITKSHKNERNWKVNKSSIFKKRIIMDGSKNKNKKGYVVSSLIQF